MGEYVYQTSGTCAREIHLGLDGDVVKHIEFIGGCNGNLKMIASLLEGMTVEKIEKKCQGNLCGDRGTSCADQLAKAVRAAYQSAQKNA